MTRRFVAKVVMLISVDISNVMACPGILEPWRDHVVPGILGLRRLMFLIFILPSSVYRRLWHSVRGQ